MKFIMSKIRAVDKARLQSADAQDVLQRSLTDKEQPGEEITHIGSATELIKPARALYLLRGA